MTEVYVYDPAMLIDLTKLDATVEILHKGMVIVYVECLSVIIISL